MYGMVPNMPLVNKVGEQKFEVKMNEDETPQKLPQSVKQKRLKSKVQIIGKELHCKQQY